MSRPKIGIVVGDLNQPRLLHGFSCIQNRYDVKIFAIENSQIVKSMRNGFSMALFPDIKDMPGYMRGLEAQVEDCDILIGVEASKLSTFQMMRIADKHNIPTAVMTTEFRPYFYANYTNILAIQTDVMEHADLFWPVSSLSKHMLVVEGVNEDKISLLYPDVDTNKFRFQETKRSKFRKHVGIDEDAQLILFENDLVEESHAEAVLMAFRLFKVTNPQQASRVKMLFVGDGAMASDLKYKCHDLRLGESVLFLHQDPESFRDDLYSASDVVLSLKRSRGLNHEPFPLNVLEAASSGCIPIYSRNSYTAEFFTEVGIGVLDESHESISHAFKELFTKPGKFRLEKEKMQGSWYEQMEPKLLSKNLDLEIQKALSKNQNMLSIISNDSVAEVQGILSRGAIDDALKKVEILLSSEPQRTKNRSKLLRIKGDALVKQSQLDQGMEAYSASLGFDEDNHLAYLGLGHIAFQGHANEDALTFFRKALAKSENNPQALMGIGMVHDRLGLSEDAIYWYELSIQMSHGSGKDASVAISALGQCCLECSNRKFAISTLERLRENILDSSSLSLVLGQLYLKDGQSEVGQKLIDEALASGNQGKSA